MAKRESKYTEIESLARIVRRDVRTIERYVARGMPRRNDGRFEVRACVDWIAANIRPSGRASDLPPGITEDQVNNRGFWETYLAREKALAEQIKRRKLCGELIEVDVVARRAEQRITHAKALLEQIPDRLLGLLPKIVSATARKEIRRRSVEMIEDALFALADADDAIAADADAEPDETQDEA